MKMKFEKPIERKALEELVQMDTHLVHQLLNNMFMDEEMSAFHMYEGQYNKEYRFVIRGEEWRAAVEYTSSKQYK